MKRASSPCPSAGPQAKRSKSSSAQKRFDPDKNANFDPSTADFSDRPILSPEQIEVQRQELVDRWASTGECDQEFKYQRDAKEAERQILETEHAQLTASMQERQARLAQVEIELQQYVSEKESSITGPAVASVDHSAADNHQKEINRLKNEKETLEQVIAAELVCIEENEREHRNLGCQRSRIQSGNGKFGLVQLKQDNIVCQLHNLYLMEQINNLRNDAGQSTKVANDQQKDTIDVGTQVLPANPPAIENQPPAVVDHQGEREKVEQAVELGKESNTEPDGYQTELEYLRGAAARSQLRIDRDRYLIDRCMLRRLALQTAVASEEARLSNIHREIANVWEKTGHTRSEPDVQEGTIALNDSNAGADQPIEAGVLLDTDQFTTDKPSGGASQQSQTICEAVSGDGLVQESAYHGRTISAVPVIDEDGNHSVKIGGQQPTNEEASGAPYASSSDELPPGEEIKEEESVLDPSEENHWNR